MDFLPTRRESLDDERRAGLLQRLPRLGGAVGGVAQNAAKLLAAPIPRRLDEFRRAFGVVRIPGDDIRRQEDAVFTIDGDGSSEAAEAVARKS